VWSKEKALNLEYYAVLNHDKSITVHLLLGDHRALEKARTSTGVLAVFGPYGSSTYEYAVTRAHNVFRKRKRDEERRVKKREK
jgi:hypothetical protein